MKILLVDDSRAMRMIVTRALRQAGYGEHPVTEAADGKQALASLHAGPFDLVLSDWNMPEMSGIELLTAVRAENIPVRFGFVTSEGSEAMRKLARDAGADFLIAKPFSIEVLQRALQGLTESVP